MKKRGDQPPTHFEDIEIPKNTPMGIYISIFVFLFGFAAVWHIIWLALFGLVGAIICLIVLSLDEHMEYLLPAAKIEKIENKRASYGA